MQKSRAIQRVLLSAAFLCAASLPVAPLFGQTPPTPKPPQEKPKEEAGKEQDTPKKEDEKKPEAAPVVDAAIAAVRAFIEKASTGESPQINKERPTWKTHLPKFPSLTYTMGKKYLWELETNQGKIKIALLPTIAPEHVSNYVYLTELGYFDGLSFHRVIPGFMAQGGCPLGTGSGGPGYGFDGEFPKENGQLKRIHDKPGILSMANTGRPSSDGGQFFLTFVPTPWLDGKHTVFGEVVEGMDTVKKLEKFGTPGTGRPTEPLSIIKATITVE